MWPHRPPANRPLVVAPDGLGCADGLWLRAVECRPVDVRSLDSGQRDAITTAFERLLRSLDTELRFMVVTRRMTGHDTGVIGGDAELAEAQSRHWAAHLASADVFARRIIVAARGPRQVAGNQLRRAVEALMGSGIDCRPLSGVDLLGDLLVTGERRPGRGWAETAAGVGTAGDELRSVVLRRLPGSAVGTGWLAPLLLARTACDICVSLTPEDDGTAMRLLGRRMRDLGAHRLAESERGTIPDAGIAHGYDAAADLRRRIATNGGRPLRLAVGVVTRERRGSAGAGVERIQAAFAGTLARSRIEHLRHAEMVPAVWGVAAWPDPGKLVDSGAAATCLPFVTSSLDDGPAAYRLGMDAATQIPISIDVFDSRRHANANIGLFAASGQGKSFLVGGVLLEARRHGHEAVIVDPEGEYRRLVEMSGGRWLDLLTEAPINPFDAAGDDDPTAGVVDTVALLCSGLSDEERARIDVAARHAIEMCRGGTRPVLRDCLAELTTTCPRVALIVRRHIDGPLRGFLDSPTSAAWSEPFIAVGHRDIREELIPVTTLLLGRFLWHLVRSRPRRRHIVLDEAGMLSAHPALRGLLGQLARRCRKYGSSLVVATQNVNDMLRSDDGQVVAGNCAIVFCGGHRAHEAQLMQRTFGLTDTQRRAVETAVRGDFVIIAGQRRAVMRVSLPELYADRIRAGAPTALSQPTHWASDVP